MPLKMQQLHFWPIKVNFLRKSTKILTWTEEEKSQKINMSKSYTFQSAVNPLCGNSFSSDHGNYQSQQKYLLTPEMGVTLEAPAVPLGSNDKALLVAFLSASRHSCLYLQCWAALIQTWREWQWYLWISHGPVHPEGSAWPICPSLSHWSKQGLSLQLLSDWSTYAAKGFGFTSHVVLEPTDLYLCNVQFWKHISALTGHKMPRYL